jgi:hypothetical protein
MLKVNIRGGCISEPPWGIFTASEAHHQHLPTDTQFSTMTSATASYELLLFLVNNLQINAETVTASVISRSAALDSNDLMATTWSQISSDLQDGLAADVHHVLSGIGQDLAFMV